MRTQAEWQTFDADLQHAAERIALFAASVDHGFDFGILAWIEAVDFARIASSALLFKCAGQRIDFHALGGTGSQEQSSSGYQAIADREGFPILFPDGIDNAWNIGPCCTNSRTVDDLGFAKGMVAAIVAQACIDTKRVYATGFSMGGGMSHYLACNAADIFAATAPSSFDLLVPDEEPCAPSRPISVLTYRGTADTTVPYAGGLGPSGRITFLGAQGSFQRWAGIDGCMTPTTVDGDCTYYKTCSAGVEVGLCVKQGGGHAPGDANVGWAFLSRFSLP